MYIYMYICIYIYMYVCIYIYIYCFIHLPSILAILFLGMICKSLELQSFPSSIAKLTSESKKYFFEIKLVSRDDMSTKSAETRIL